MHFARAFERNKEIKLYAKLPPWFQIDTPLGSYNPDWAVVVETASVERLYFVVETKGSLFTDALRPIEKAKIECGKAHLSALDENVAFRVDDRYESLMDAFTN